MSNIWVDQPREAEGTTLLHISIGRNSALQVQVVNVGGGIVNYAATVGGLFGSKTFVDTSLESVLQQANRLVNNNFPVE